jgi:flagellin-like hook-associated protein FlgL
MRTQITELAEDSGYKGKNLLSNTTTLRSMVVQFEGTTLNVQGFDATATGLGMTQATWTAGGTTAIDADLVALDSALSTMRQNASKLAGNLSIITVRQDFSTNMINMLTEGSDKLTLADANEEGANMLMLQTRQSLSTSALSMSAQAAQSVLRLFQ